MANKLYRVTVKHTYFAYTEDKSDAMYFYKDAVGDTYANEVCEVEEVKTPAQLRADNWNLNCFVYHNDDDSDITLGNAYKESRDGTN